MIFPAMNFSVAERWSLEFVLARQIFTQPGEERERERERDQNWYNEGKASH